MDLISHQTVCLTEYFFYEITEIVCGRIKKGWINKADSNLELDNKWDLWKFMTGYYEALIYLSV